MAITYEDKWSAGRASAFWHRVAIALEIAAIDLIIAGFDADPTIAARQRRFVREILNDPRGPARFAALALASKIDIDDSATDATIQTNVTNNFDRLAWAFDDA